MNLYVDLGSWPCLKACYKSPAKYFSNLPAPRLTPLEWKAHIRDREISPPLLRHMLVSLRISQNPQTCTKSMLR